MMVQMIKKSEKKIRFTFTVIALSLGLCLATVTTAADESGSHTTTDSAENHGDEAEPNLNPLAFDPDLALFTGLVFLLLLLILWKFAWGPILAGLAAREDGIAANIDQAQQDAEAAAAKLQEYEEQLTAATEEARTIMAKAQVDAQAAADAIEIGFGNRPVFIREGGSIPIINTFAEKLGAEILLLGWGQNDDNLHAPNEKFSLADFHNGIRASAALWSCLAGIKQNS